MSENQFFFFGITLLFRQNKAQQINSLIPGARFWKVPKLYGPFSGVTIPSVSRERRWFKSSNFTDSLLFVTLKTC